MGESLDECAKKYRKFCYQYQPPEKSVKKFYWGSQLLPKLTRKNKKTNTKKKPTEKQKNFIKIGKKNNPEVVAVAEKFILGMRI